LFVVPDECQNEIIGLEHLIKCLSRRFNAYPAVFMGTLKEALKEAFSQKEITEVRTKFIFLRINFYLTLASSIFNLCE